MKYAAGSFVFPYFNYKKPKNMYGQNSGIVEPSRDTQLQTIITNFQYQLEKNQSLAKRIIESSIKFMPIMNNSKQEACGVAPVQEGSLGRLHNLVNELSANNLALEIVSSHLEQIV